MKRALRLQTPIRSLAMTIALVVTAPRLTTQQLNKLAQMTRHQNQPSPGGNSPKDLLSITRKLHQRRKRRQPLDSSQQSMIVDFLQQRSMNILQIIAKTQTIPGYSRVYFFQLPARRPLCNSRMLTITLRAKKYRYNSPGLALYQSI